MQALWARGWKVRFEASSVAWHDKGGSAGAVRSPRLNFAFHRGMHRFYSRWEAPERPLPVNIAVYAGYLRQARRLARPRSCCPPRGQGSVGALAADDRGKG